MQPKNKVACTLALLQNPEGEADVSDLGDDEDASVAVPSSIVVTADHGPGRDDGGSLAMVDERPEPTRRTPMLHGRMLGDASVAVGCTGDGARCVGPSRQESWRHGVLPRVPLLLLWWVEWEQTTTPVTNGWESTSNEPALKVRLSSKVAFSPPMVEVKRAPPTLALSVLSATVREW